MPSGPGVVPGPYAGVQVAAPPAMLGRVIASIRLFSRGGTPIGAVAFGALAGAVSPRTTLVLLIALPGLAPVWLLCSPVGRVRDAARLAP